MPRYSRSRSRSRSRGRYDRRNREEVVEEEGPYRLHIADITDEVKEADIQKAFGKFGTIEDVWLAKNPPCFAFCAFSTKKEAEDAQREMDGRTVCGSRIRVTWARPRTRGQRKHFDPNMRCYQCGKRGHFSRDCDGGRGGGGGGGRRSRSRSRGRDDRRYDSRRNDDRRDDDRRNDDRRNNDRSRSRNRSYTRSRTGSRSPNRNGNSRN